MIYWLRSLIFCWPVHGCLIAGAILHWGARFGWHDWGLLAGMLALACFTRWDAGQLRSVARSRVAARRRERAALARPLRAFDPAGDQLGEATDLHRGACP